MSVLVAVADHKGDIFIGSDTLISLGEKTYPKELPAKTKWFIIRDDFAMGAAGESSAQVDGAQFEPDLGQTAPEIVRAYRNFLLDQHRWTPPRDSHSSPYLDIQTIIVHQGEIFTAGGGFAACRATQLPDLKRSTRVGVIGCGSGLALGAMWGTAKYQPDGIYITNAGILAAGHFHANCGGIWVHKLTTGDGGGEKG